MFVAVLWIALPFAVFGIKRRLDDIIFLLERQSPKERHEAMKELERQSPKERREAIVARLLKERKGLIAE